MSSPDLRTVLLQAAAGRFPQVDGGWEAVRPWSSRVAAVVALTGHAYLAVPADLVQQVPTERVDGYGGAHDPRVVTALAGPGGWIDCLDALLVHPGHGPSGADATEPGPAVKRVVLVPRPDLSHHPRAALARALRDDVDVLGVPDPRCGSLLTVGTGIAGLTEVGIELDPGSPVGSPTGRDLLAAVVALQQGAPLVAAVAPGNARALRLFLGSGFVPVGSVQLFSRADLRPAPAPAR